MPRDALDPVDVHVGQRLRAMRKAKGTTQELLADVLGLSFQQVQKYEKGQNRISASVLREMALALDRPVGDFYEGLPMPGAPVLGEAAMVLRDQVAGMAKTADGRTVLGAWALLGSMDRRAFARFAKAITKGVQHVDLEG